jgi:hypothetical protein
MREYLPPTNQMLMPTLTLEQAAQAIVDGTDQKRSFVVKPAIFRAMFVLNALFPRFVARQREGTLRRPTEVLVLRGRWSRADSS